MNRRWDLNKLLFVIFASVLCLVVSCRNESKSPGNMASVGAVKEPAEGIKITLSVYSGRPNPEWWVTEGPLYKRLVALSRELKTSSRAAFDYGQWNRLGYASFWIRPKNIKGMPYAIHVWRDMACVFQDVKGARLYADEAGELYDLLVDYAEQNKQGVFFANYRKSKKQR